VQVQRTRTKQLLNEPFFEFHFMRVPPQSGTPTVAQRGLFVR